VRDLRAFVERQLRPEWTRPWKGHKCSRGWNGWSGARRTSKRTA